MTERRRHWWNRYVPTHVSNPFRLAYKLLRSAKPEARSALFMAAAGVVLSPVDAALQLPEKRRYERSAPARGPVLLVCGPPRSGTTLIAQYLINAFKVCYLNNLTSLFPRAPITANRLFGRFTGSRSGAYSSYYGKSRRLSDANDALYIWDRWLGSDRENVPARLAPGSGRAMPLFFGALEASYGLPIVNKANRLNTCAALVAEHLDNALFICAHRDPLTLAQSLYIARREIVGDMRTPYGVKHADANPSDPVEDICLQVVFHERMAREQQALLGEEAFWIVSYEEFCNRPAALAEAVREHKEGLQFRERERLDQQFVASSSPKLEPDLVDRMRQILGDLGAGNVNCRRF